MKQLKLSLLIIVMYFTQFDFVLADNIMNTNWRVRKFSSAIEKGKLEQARKYINEGIKFEYKNKEYTPLHHAVFKNRHDIIVLLLSAGININLTDALNRTALHDAAIYNRLKIAKLLIGHHAEINTFGKYGSTPLVAASQNGHTAIVELLLENSANPNLINKLFQVTALHAAVSNGNIISVKLLLEASANVNKKNRNGKTPLHYAIRGGRKGINRELVKLLLEHGADTSIRDNQAMSVLDYISKYKTQYIKNGVAELINKKN